MRRAQVDGRARTAGGLAAVLVALALFPVGPVGASQHIDQITGKGGTFKGEIVGTGASASATFVQGSVTQGATISDIVVCIAVTTSSASDVGCSLAPDGVGSVDDLLSSGSMDFSIPSESFPGGTLSVRVTLTAYGSYDAGPFSLFLAPGPEAGARANAQVIRDARVTGNIGSSTLGAGTLHPHTPGKLFRTAQATVVYHPERLALEATTSRASVSTLGVQGNAPSEDPSISDDGRYIAFASSASTLVEDDTNGVRDVFVHDRVLGLTRRVSSPCSALDLSCGSQSNGPSAVESGPVISGNGQYVAFSSAASNLVAGDTNERTDIFVHDLIIRHTEPIFSQADGHSGEPSISRDGRFLAFSSSATNLVPGDTNGKTDVFVYDRGAGTAGTMERISSPIGGQSNGDSSEPAIDWEGFAVAFSSLATNLVPGDTNLVQDVFVGNRGAGVVKRVSVDPTNMAEASGPSGEPAISPYRNWVAFSSSADNLAPNDLAGNKDVFVMDYFRIGLSGQDWEFTTVGHVCAGDSVRPALSDTSVAFASNSEDLVEGDRNGRSDVFVRRLDMPARLSRRVSLSSFGLEGTGNSVDPAISSDDRFVAFESMAPDLSLLDDNGHPDVVVRDNGVLPPLPPPATPNGLQARLNAPDGAPSDEFGSSVDIEGTTAVVGAPLRDEDGLDSGAVYVFTPTGCAWSQRAKLVAPDGGGGDHFGASVALKGDTLIVGAPLDDDVVLGTDSGSAYVFVRSGGTWSMEAKLTAPEGAVGDHFGESVTISSFYDFDLRRYVPRIVVGSPFDDDKLRGEDTGSVFEFTRPGGSWLYQAQIKGEGQGQFGASVTLEGGPLIVGAPRQNPGSADSGTVHIFERGPSSWQSGAVLRPARPEAGDRFGASLAAYDKEGSRFILVGAPLGRSDDSGYAELFNYSGREQEFPSPESSPASAGNMVGSSVALGLDIALMAAPNDDGPAADSGSVYAYAYVSPPIPTCDPLFGGPCPRGNWALEATLTAPGVAAGDFFGASVALQTAHDPVTAIVGAPRRDDKAQNAGAAFVFVAR